MRPDVTWRPGNDFTALAECRKADGSTLTCSFADDEQARNFIDMIPAFQGQAEAGAEILDVVATRIVPGLWGAN